MSGTYSRTCGVRTDGCLKHLYGEPCVCRPALDTADDLRISWTGPERKVTPAAFVSADDGHTWHCVECGSVDMPSPDHVCVPETRSDVQTDNPPRKPREDRRMPYTREQFDELTEHLGHRCAGHHLQITTSRVTGMHIRHVWATSCSCGRLWHWTTEPRLAFSQARTHWTDAAASVRASARTLGLRTRPTVTDKTWQDRAQRSREDA